MTRLRSFALAALAAPLTLAIAACDSTDVADEEALSGEPVAAVDAPAGTPATASASVPRSSISALRLAM